LMSKEFQSLERKEKTVIFIAAAIPMKEYIDFLNKKD